MAACALLFDSRILACMNEKAVHMNDSTAPYDAIFFDMDGTLLPLEVRDFLVPYYELLAIAAKRARFDAQLLQEGVNAGIMRMYDHPTDHTNEAAFWDAFFGVYFCDTDPTDIEKRAMYAFLDDFYAHDFDKAGEAAVPHPAARRVLETLSAKGYPLYLTTMPMFPLSAIEWRMKWADAPIEVFERVTTFDNSTSVKPHLDYYRENIALADVPADRILMVGNNTMDDLVCMNLGMDAYLVTDYLINVNDFDIDTVKHGTLEEFAQWAETLPACTNDHARSWRDRADSLRGGNASPESASAAKDTIADAIQPSGDSYGAL